jgi:hypothetical protein
MPKPETDDVILRRSEYHLVNSELGFYDFLRNRDMAIIGLRFSPFEEKPILDYAFPLSYTYVDRKRCFMEVYFSGHRGVLVHGTAEQAFGDDSVWRNDMGTYAIQVGTNGLGPEELAALKRLSTQSSS